MSSNIFEAGGHYAYFDGPETDLGDLLPGFDANRLSMAFNSIEYTGDFESIENEAIKTGSGTYPRTKGKPMVTFSAEAYLEGLNTIADAATQAPRTCLSLLVASCFGEAPSRSNGGLVAAAPAPTPSSFTYQVAPTNPPVPGDLIAVQLATGVEVVPVLTYAAGAVTLSVALSASPVDGDAVYGSNSVKWKKPGKHEFFIQNEIVGLDQTEHMKQFGMYGNFALPGASANEIQKFTYECPEGTAFQDYLTPGWVDPTSLAPSAVRPYVAAGGRYWLSTKTSVSAPTLNDWLGLEFNSNAVFVGQPHLNTREKRWCAVAKMLDSVPSVTLFFAPNDDPAGSASTWREVWRDGGPDNRFIWGAQWGNQAGELAALVGHDMHMVGPPEKADFDGLRVWKVMLEPLAGSDAATTMTFAQM